MCSLPLIDHLTVQKRGALSGSALLCGERSPNSAVWTIQFTGWQQLRRHLRLGEPVAKLESGVGPVSCGLRHNNPSLANERCWLQAMQLSSHGEGKTASVSMDEV